MRVLVAGRPKSDAWNGWFPGLGGAKTTPSRIFVKQLAFPGRTTNFPTRRERPICANYKMYLSQIEKCFRRRTTNFPTRRERSLLSFVFGLVFVLVCAHVFVFAFAFAKTCFHRTDHQPPNQEREIGLLSFANREPMVCKGGDELRKTNQ